MNTQFHPLVSIVIPVYNGSNYLKEAIDSALAQTYDNIEVLVINDGSNDNGATEAIAKSYGDKIRYFSKENGGVATALNMGIENMRGEYFSWLSHDDVYFKYKIKSQIELIKNNEKFVFVYGGYQLIDCNGNIINNIIPDIVYPSKDKKLHLYRGLINGCTVLINRNVFEDIGIFDVRYQTTQDYHMWNKILHRYKCIGINDVVCKTRIHREQGSKKINFHNKEGDELWKSMLSDVTDEEASQIMASTYAFFDSTAKFLQGTPYKGAEIVARQRAEHNKKSLSIDNINVLVSIIIPCYNDTDVVKDAICSAKQQTYKNCEIIVVDDGSEENVTELMNFCKNNDVMFVSTSHCGRSHARNYGIRISHGEYIAFLDADDLFCKNKIYRQMQEIFKTGALACHTSYISIINNKKKYNYTGKFCGKLYPQILGGCTIATPTVILRRDIIPDKLFPEDIEYGEDNIAWIKISQMTTWAHIDEGLAIVRIRKNSCSIDNEKQTKGIINIIRYIINNDNHIKYVEEYNNIIKYYMGLKDKVLYNNEINTYHIGELFNIISNYYKKYGIRKTIIRIIKSFLTLKIKIGY